MKGLRALTTGILAIAVAGAGLSNVLVAQAATPNTPPVITSIVLGVIRAGVVVPTAVVNEGDTLQIDVTFTDPDTADMESVTVFWADAPSVAFTLTAGQRSFFVQRTFLDDFPSNTPVDSIQFTVDISDLVNPSVSRSGSVTVQNVAPVVTAFTVTPAAILDHQSVTAAGSFSDPGLDTFSLALDWGDGSAKTVQTFGSRAVKDFSLTHLYLVGGAFTVTATVTDDDTGVGTATAPVVVSSLNTAPSDLAATAGPALEGGTATLAVTFVDPDAGDVHTVSLAWGDGSAPQSLGLLAGVTSFSPTHVYQDSGTYNATVKVADGAASTAPVTVVVTVANVAPTVMAENLSAPSIVEQESVMVEATFADPGVSDIFTLTMAWGDGTSWSTDVPAGTRAAAASHLYMAAGTFVITVTVKDRDNATGSMTKTLEVRARNRAPSGLTLTANSPAGGSAANLTGSFTDLDATDTHTVSVTWGDASTGTLALGAGVGTFSATHTYATSGTYHVNATVTDRVGLAASAGVDVVVQKKKEKSECDSAAAFEQRHTWLNDHDAHGLLARATAMLSSRFGCDDEDEDDHRSDDHRSDDQHADKHAQVKVNTHADEHSAAKDLRTRRNER